MAVVEVNGGRVACWDRGSGPALLLIHGVGTDGELWAGDLAPLEDEVRVITYNRRGYDGSSESPRDWRVHRDDAIALIETLDAAPVTVVGYSGGSIPALDLVLARPDLVASVVLLDPAFNVKRCITPAFARTLVTTQLLRRLRGERRALEYYMPWVASYSTGGTAWDKSPAERREKLLGNGPGVFADYGSGGGEHIDESRLAQIAVPVTIVDAKLSPAFLAKSKARLRKLLPQARYVTIEDSGHAIGVDAPTELMELLREAVRAPGAESAA